MNYYYKQKDYIYLHFDYREDWITHVKENLGMYYNSANSEWYIQTNLSNLPVINYFLRKNGFIEDKRQNPPRFPLSFEKIEDKIAVPEIKSALKELKLDRFPRKYQIQGIHYMINHNNCINADAAGVGKTGQMILTIELLDLFPCLIVTPASVKYGWKKEWARWVKEREVEVIESKKKNDWTKDVIVINYDILGVKDKETKTISMKFPELLKNNFKTIVFDEIHFLKEDKSIRSKSALKIAKKVKKIYGLSGTIAMNRPKELISILTIMQRFGELFPNRTYYFQRYCNAKRTQYGMDISCSNNVLELHKILEHRCYIRREKRDVLSELPPTTKQIIDVNITNTREYEKAQKDILTYLMDIDLDKALAAERAKHLVLIKTLRQLSVKGKMKGIELFLNEWLESNENEKLLVFGNFRDPLKELSTKFDSHLIQGGISSERKQEIVDSFVTDKKRILFANIESIGTGVDNLQHSCSNMVFIELPQRPSDLDQAISRIERQGQINPISIYFLLCQETIDQSMWKILEEKREVVDVINKGRCEEEDFAKIILLELIAKMKRR